MAFALALVFAELGALIRTSGSLAQIPLLSHGRFSGFVGGWAAWIAYVTLTSIEVMATIDYLSSSFPILVVERGGSENLSAAGIGVALTLLVLFAVINLAGVVWLARWIDGLSGYQIQRPLTGPNPVPISPLLDIMSLAGRKKGL